MSEAGQLGPSNDGTVMIDIGGDIGALIIHTGSDLLLAEIEISRVDGAPPVGHAQPHTHADGSTHTHGDAARTHVAVRERRGPSGVRYAAIYPQLQHGEYTVWGLDGTAHDVVTVRGGEIAELHWR